MALPTCAKYKGSPCPEEDPRPRGSLKALWIIRDQVSWIIQDYIIFFECWNALKIGNGIEVIPWQYSSTWHQRACPKACFVEHETHDILRNFGQNVYPVILSVPESECTVGATKEESNLRVWTQENFLESLDYKVCEYRNYTSLFLYYILATGTSSGI